MVSVGDKDLDGLRGWLILIMIGLIVSPIRIGLFVYQTFVPIFTDGTWEALTDSSSTSYHHIWAPLISFEILGNFAVVILGLVTLYFFLKKSRRTPKLAIAWLLSAVTFTVSDYFFADMIPFIAAQPADPESIKEVARSLVSAVIWVPYFLVSKRVKATFTR